jgi:preprotein translocase subunit YajC
MFFTAQTFSGVHISIKKVPQIYIFLLVSFTVARPKKKQQAKRSGKGKKENGKLHNEQFLM